MATAASVKICYFSLIFSCIIGVAHLTVTDIYQNILYTQYDESDPCLDSGAENINAPFDGGDDYFNNHFSHLTRRVRSQVASLKLLNISRRSVAPRAEHILSILNSVSESSGHDSAEVDIKKTWVLLGVNSELLFCYENGVYAACGTEEESIFRSTSSTWNYRHSCTGWRATLIDTALRIHETSDIYK